MTGFRNLKLKIGQEGVAELCLDRPDVLNALNHETLGEIETAFLELEQDESVRVVILSGNGKRAFCAGADISEVFHLNSESGWAFSRRGQELLSRIEGGSMLVIAALQGFCLGGGCELAMACHLRIATNDAKFGMPEVKIGVIPGFGGTQRLTRIVGKSSALELLLCGGSITAREAYNMGLVDKVVKCKELHPTCRELASRVARQAPLAVKYCLEAVNQGLEMSLESGLSLESRLFGRVTGTEDMKEGTQAFIDGRKASFKGQ